jgi:hypothetical protein
MGFIIDWSKYRKNSDFLDRQKKALNKWEKRNGKKSVRPHAAAAAAFPDLFAVPPSQEHSETFNPTTIDQQVDQEMDEPAAAASPMNTPTPPRNVSPLSNTNPVPPIHSPIRFPTRMNLSPPPVAGPSNPRQDSIHIYPSFSRLAESSDDEPIVKRKRVCPLVDYEEQETDSQNERPPSSDYQEERLAHQKQTKKLDDKKRMQ